MGGIYSMKPEAILKQVCRSLDALVEAGDRYEGLFPSLLDRKTREMLRDLPPPIEGQRQGDRAHPGSNLMHDQTALKTMYGLSRALGRREYEAAADRYLRRFATHCTDTTTGLFPWGEHAFWNLLEDRVGDSHRLGNPDKAPGTTLHDHLRQAPVWLWEKLYEYNPICVKRFAEGLDYHYKEGEPREYIRHAHIERRERLKRGPKSADFPRHGGFYILDWSFAYLKTDRRDFLGLIEEMVDYWWPHRDGKGLLMVHSRAPEDDPRFYRVNIPSQTLSLAASLLESAALFDGKEAALARRMRERAEVYIEGFLTAPHDLERDIFVYTCRRGTDEILSTVSAWGSVYGHWPAAYVALICLCAYRLTGNAGLLRWAESVGRCYLNAPFPEGGQVPIMDAGLEVELMADLCDVTGEASWLEEGLGLAEKLTAVYMDGDLPRGAAGIEWYESQMQPGDLLHGLARLALLALHKDDCPLKPNYSGK